MCSDRAMPSGDTAGDAESTMQLLSGLAELMSNIPPAETDAQYRYDLLYRA